jgi:hypothetical protein
MLVQDTTASRGESISAARGLVSASKHNLDNVSETTKAIDFEDLERRVVALEQRAAADKESEKW